MSFILFLTVACSQMSMNSFSVTAYLMTEAGLGKRSLRVRCFVCEKEWFQTTERLLKTDNQHHLQNMTEDKIEEVRRLQQAMNWQSRQTGRKDKVGVFVGNLPYTFDEVIKKRNSLQFSCLTGSNSSFNQNAIFIIRHSLITR